MGEGRLKAWTVFCYLTRGRHEWPQGCESRWLVVNVMPRGWNGQWYRRGVEKGMGAPRGREQSSVVPWTEIDPQFKCVGQSGKRSGRRAPLGTLSRSAWNL